MSLPYFFEDTQERQLCLMASILIGLAYLWCCDRDMLLLKYVN